ncbi:tubulin-specific chaperone A-like [Pecten maximus]|nr:tubulin-specific chaperone A-like [Pecten maximus]
MLEKKVEKMAADGKDEYDIRKQKEVLEESQKMVPDTQRRLKKGLEDLESYMKEVEDLKDTEKYNEAMEVYDAGVKAKE